MYAIALVVTVLVERRRIMCIPQSLLCIGRVDVVVGARGVFMCSRKCIWTRYEYFPPARGGVTNMKPRGLFSTALKAVGAPAVEPRGPNELSGIRIIIWPSVRATRSRFGKHLCASPEYRVYSGFHVPTTIGQCFSGVVVSRFDVHRMRYTRLDRISTNVQRAIPMLAALLIKVL